MGLFIVVAFAASGLAASQGVIMSSSSSSNIQHVILIMMENHGYSQIIGNSSAPYTNQLANTYALATNYDAVFHPSLPNYLAITSGSNDGITTDCVPSSSCETSASNIFSLLQNHGYTWKEYAESMPSNCYSGNYGSLPNEYIVHHTPPPYYTDLSSACSQYDVPLGDASAKTGNFFNDLSSGSLPNFAFVTPNICDDMHTCPSGTDTIASGDKWLSELIPSIISSPEWSSSVTFLVWDEGYGSDYSSNHVAMIVIGPASLVKTGQFSQSYTHYSTLATIEDIFNLGNLGRNDASATPMTAIININSISTSTSSTHSSSSSSSTSTKTTSATSSSTSVSSTTTKTTSTSSSSSTATSSSSTTTSSSSNSSTSSSSQSFVGSSSLRSSAASSSSSANSGTLSQSNPIVGMLAALSPAKDPPVAYSLATYELCLFGALGYVLIGARKGGKDGWRW